ncbi:MAG: Hint domain-containing protein [Alphaproteobacteria bacterium]|nr:Hint domain-containing protein [Alphaproteobacteria bacterium]
MASAGNPPADALGTQIAAITLLKPAPAFGAHAIAAGVTDFSPAHQVMADSWFIDPPAAGPGDSGSTPQFVALTRSSAPGPTPTIDHIAASPTAAAPAPAGPIETTSAITANPTFTLNLEFDGSVTNAPAYFMTDIQAAANLIDAAIKVTASVTVNLTVSYDTALGGGAEAGPSSDGAFVPYSDLKTALTNNSPNDPNLADFPAASALNGQTSVVVWGAELRSLDAVAANQTIFTNDAVQLPAAGAIDGTATFGTVADSSLVGVALHELTHAMGRSPYGPTQADVFDLFRYINTGTIQNPTPGGILIDDATPASKSAYFSVNGGVTDLADYGVYSDPSDFLNSVPETTGQNTDSASPRTPNDAFNQYYDGSTSQTLSAVDLQQLDVLGFNTSAACYCRGTKILTPGGEVSIETLRIGDLVVTVDGNSRPIRWIGRRAYGGRFIAGNRDILPICIKPDAIMAGVPARELWVSPEHAIYIDDVLVQAKHLINGGSVVQATAVDEVEYFHIELGAHDVIYADGAPAETFVDCDNRLMFTNGAEFATLYPQDDSPRWQFCAPRLDWGWPELVAIRSWMFARARALGYTVERDPELHLLIDGVAVMPVPAATSAFRFDIPAGSQEVWLGSTVMRPSECDAGSTDTRPLGVALARLVLFDSETSLEIWHGHAALTDGFYDNESTHRWTSGRARLPDALLRPFTGSITLDIYLLGDKAADTAERRQSSG